MFAIEVDSSKVLAISTPFKAPSTVSKELEAYTMALMVNTSIAEIEGKQPARSKAKLNTEAVDTKELVAYI